MGGAAHAPSRHELDEMKSLLAQAMDEGAIGLASGLIYPPSAYGTTDELAALCAVVREKGGLYASHIRNEGTSSEAGRRTDRRRFRYACSCPKKAAGRRTGAA